MRGHRSSPKSFSCPLHKRVTGYFQSFRWWWVFLSWQVKWSRGWKRACHLPCVRSFPLWFDDVVGYKMILKLSYAKNYLMFSVLSFQTLFLTKIRDSEINFFIFFFWHLTFLAIIIDTNERNQLSVMQEYRRQSQINNSCNQETIMHCARVYGV